MVFHEDRGMMKFHFILAVLYDLAINHHINLAWLSKTSFIIRESKAAYLNINKNPNQINTNNKQTK